MELDLDRSELEHVTVAEELALDPLVVRCCLATYYLDDGPDHLTLSEDLQRQYTVIRQRYGAL